MSPNRQVGQCQQMVSGPASRPCPAGSLQRTVSWGDVTDRALSALHFGILVHQRRPTGWHRASPLRTPCAPPGGAVRSPIRAGQSLAPGEAAAIRADGGWGCVRRKTSG